MNNPLALIRKNILKLTPYSSARQEYTGNEGIFLDANENAFGSVVEKSLNRYPDPLQQKLKAKIGHIKNVRPESIFLGNGSDEAIDLLIRAFCEPREEKIIVLPPTYGMYEVCAAINAVEVCKIPLHPSFEINVKEVLAQADHRVKLIFICSPNNPTANCFAASAIETLLHNFHGVVIIDEAYIDFAVGKSWLPRLTEFNNLVILQTFSKAWGLANIRLGMAFAPQPALIKILNKIKYPYNVSGVTQQIVLNALDKVQEKDRMVQQILHERNRLRSRLEALPIVKTIYPSDANFLLVKVQDAREIYQFLVEHHVIVRNRSNVTHCENCLRITVGTPEENDTLIQTLKKYST